MAPGDVFVDCGAYDGDTARQVISRNPQFSRIVAIEPDPDNFAKLRRWVGSLDGQLAERIATFNVAVGARKGQVTFRADGTEGAHLRWMS
jgi:FkbM family methyltransferase